DETPSTEHESTPDDVVTHGVLEDPLAPTVDETPSTEHDSTPDDVVAHGVLEDPLAPRVDEIPAGPGVDPAPEALDAAATMVAEPAVATPVAVEPALVAPRAIRMLFARLNRLELDADSLNGVTVYRACAPGVPADVVHALTTQLLPFLDDGWSGPIEQITVRGSRMALVVTVLG